MSKSLTRFDLSDTYPAAPGRPADAPAEIRDPLALGSFTLWGVTWEISDTRHYRDPRSLAYVRPAHVAVEKYGRPDWSPQSVTPPRTRTPRSVGSVYVETAHRHMPDRPVWIDIRMSELSDAATDALRTEIEKHADMIPAPFTRAERVQSRAKYLREYAGGHATDSRDEDNLGAWPSYQKRDEEPPLTREERATVAAAYLESVRAAVAEWIETGR